MSTPRTPPLLALGLTLTLLLSATPAAAGDHADAIAKIRALYAEVGQGDVGPDGERLNVITTQLDTIQPATGAQTTKLTFILGEHRESEEQVYADLYLRKVVASWNFAARAFTSEYLYAGRDGELVFHFASDGETEVRTYFAGGELIRVLRKPAPGGPMEIDPVTKDAGFDDHDRAEAAKIQERGKRHHETYRQLSKSMDGELGS